MYEYMGTPSVKNVGGPHDFGDGPHDFGEQPQVPNSIMNKKKTVLAKYV